MTSLKRSTFPSAQFKALPPLPLTPPDTPDVTEGCDVDLQLVIGKKSLSKKSTWSANITDFFILSCSFFLTTASIVFVALIFHTLGSWYYSPNLGKALSILQRTISSLSLSITSAMIMVAGKRYALFKLARGGLRSRGVAVYSNATIGSLANYLVSHGVELPLLGFLIVWGLALVTGLTVDESWEMGPDSEDGIFAVPSGPLVPAAPGSSWLTRASEQLYLVMSSLCSKTADTVGLINITGGESGGTIYPPLLFWEGDLEFSFSTTMNGFNTSTEQLSSLPSTVQYVSCVQGTGPVSYWFDDFDNQTFSIIVAEQREDSGPKFLRLNATAIIMGGTLSSTESYVEFALNGTSWLNVMSTGSQWAQDINSIICNTTTPIIGDCVDLSFPAFASWLNANFTQMDMNWPLYWSTISNMALGAYSSAIYLNITATNIGNFTSPEYKEVLLTIYNAQFTAHYGVYILIVNVVASVIMLIVVARLHLASHLGPDFINSTRLLLDPLKRPDLFNASLTETVDALGDPYMLVREDNTFLLEERELAAREGNWMKRVVLRGYWWRIE